MSEIPFGEKIDQTLEDIEREYEAEDVPVTSYYGLIALYSLVFGGLFLFATRGGRKIKKPTLGELVTLTLGSYKLSRVITMSFIGSAVRAPFTKRGKSLKGGEVQDESRGEGMQKAIGNLVTCPFCFNVWSNTFFLFGHAVAPNLTLQVARILGMAAAGDVLHHGYRTLREKSE